MQYGMKSRHNGNFWSMVIGMGMWAVKPFDY